MDFLDFLDKVKGKKIEKGNFVVIFIENEWFVVDVVLERFERIENNSVLRLICVFLVNEEILEMIYRLFVEEIVKLIIYYL